MDTLSPPLLIVVYIWGAGLNVMETLSYFMVGLFFWSFRVVKIRVIRAVFSKTQIQCACLGTVFKLPMSTVTIVENVGMVLMAGAMLLAL